MEERGSRELDPKVATQPWRPSWLEEVGASVSTVSCFPQISTRKSTAETCDNSSGSYSTNVAVTELLGLRVSARSFRANGHFSSSSREAGSAQPENTALVSLGWSEGTMGASPEDCRQTQAVNSSTR